MEKRAKVVNNDSVRRSMNHNQIHSKNTRNKMTQIKSGVIPVKYIGKRDRLKGKRVELACEKNIGKESISKVGDIRFMRYVNMSKGAEAVYKNSVKGKNGINLDDRAEIHHYNKVDKAYIIEKDRNCGNRTMLIDFDRKNRDLREDASNIKDDKKTISNKDEHKASECYLKCIESDDSNDSKKDNNIVTMTNLVKINRELAKASIRLGSNVNKISMDYIKKKRLAWKCMNKGAGAK
ncbi:5496_t:CDS:2 [Dentiscutata erythropus]|uniref:5496_t:CDS:1 n=1 Tax=Dentiscutata erythropus TaxID=1348616 RepID=A0A9N9B4S8_9GLOM|nr:5496_t:CDS:2 [Dentiscutata erythropus]